jgi:hypothetical protein
MNTKLSQKIFQLALLVSLLLSLALTGCAGAMNYGVGTPTIVSLGAAETIRGIKSVVAGAPGTFALIDASKQVLILAWPRGQAYAFSMLDVDGKFLTSNAMKLATMSLATSVKGLQAQGWQILTRTEIPLAVARAVSAYSVEMMMLGVKGLPTIFVIPYFLIPDQFKDTRTYWFNPATLSAAA